MFHNQYTNKFMKNDIAIICKSCYIIIRPIEFKVLNKKTLKNSSLKKS